VRRIGQKSNEYERKEGNKSVFHAGTSVMRVPHILEAARDGAVT
jgi:hypothetical protein